MGSSINVSIKQKIKALPDRARKLFGRERIIVDVVKKLSENTYVWITGEDGIGKSAIAKEVAHLIYDRDQCKDGVLYLSLKDVEYFEDLINLLFKSIKHSLIDSDKRIELNNFMSSGPEEKYHSCLFAIKDMEILIVLDN